MYTFVILLPCTSIISPTSPKKYFFLTLRTSKKVFPKILHEVMAQKVPPFFQTNGGQSEVGKGANGFLRVGENDGHKGNNAYILIDSIIVGPYPPLQVIFKRGDYSAPCRAPSCATVPSVPVICPKK